MVQFPFHVNGNRNAASDIKPGTSICLRYIHYHVGVDAICGCFIVDVVFSFHPRSPLCCLSLMVPCNVIFPGQKITIHDHPLHFPEASHGTVVWFAGVLNHIGYIYIGNVIIVSYVQPSAPSIVHVLGLYYSLLINCHAIGHLFRNCTVVPSCWCNCPYFGHCLYYTLVQLTFARTAFPAMEEVYLVWNSVLVEPMYLKLSYCFNLLFT